MTTIEYLLYGLKATITLESISITGSTYNNRDLLKSLGAKWSAEQKAWKLPYGTDLSSLRPPPPPPRQTYQPNMWAFDRIRNNRRKECCSQCKREFDEVNPQGPMWFVCPVHGKWQSDYTGD
jgi:hypothetical protein